jgi:hypothetical protein
MPGACVHHGWPAVPRAAARRGRPHPHLDAALTHPMSALARPAARETRRSSSESFSPVPRHAGLRTSPSDGQSAGTSR